MFGAGTASFGSYLFSCKPKYETMKYEPIAHKSQLPVGDP